VAVRDWHLRPGGHIELEDRDGSRRSLALDRGTFR
jgi:hypothetical protein